MIFVFGSNEAGVHGLGAAKVALKRFGAEYGKGYGLQGESFAIPTKDFKIRTLPLNMINNYVNYFLKFAYDNPSMEFYVTRIGTGLAGYTDEEIAPMFETAPKNCHFDIVWEQILGKNHNYFEGNL
jgi:hypothetical protein